MPSQFMNITVSSAKIIKLTNKGTNLCLFVEEGEKKKEREKKEKTLKNYLVLFFFSFFKSYN